jgi:hypothetical protein
VRVDVVDSVGVGVGDTLGLYLGLYWGHTTCRSGHVSTPPYPEMDTVWPAV